jgi:hypothetical protein
MKLLESLSHLTTLHIRKSFKMLNFCYQRGNLINFSAMFNNFSLLPMLIIVSGIFRLKKIHFASGLTILLPSALLLFNDYVII